MTIIRSRIKTFKIKNRKGYAALCLDRLTEGASTTQAIERMIKALRRGGIEVK
jgi:hypothetical protein